MANASSQVGVSNLRKKRIMGLSEDWVSSLSTLQGWTNRSWRLFPLVLLVTTAVIGLPIALVWALRADGALTSSWLAVAVAVGASLVISWMLRLAWARVAHRSDLLFGELLLWGWLTHLRYERQLKNAARLLDAVDIDSARASTRVPRRRRAALDDPSWRARLIRQLANALDAQDAYLHGHSRRVARHAAMIGRRMGLPAPELRRLRAAAAIHDVGKLFIPHEVLDKPGALTDEEFAEVQQHAEQGARIVAALGDPQLTAIVLPHHERIDGAGYPAGLASDEIPVGARIVAVADTFDAITSPRPYRPAAEHRRAISILRDCAGSQLDPAAVDAFLSCYAGWRQSALLAMLVALPQRAFAKLLGPGSGTSVPVLSSGNTFASLVATAAVAVVATGAPAKSEHLVASRDGRAAVVSSSAASYGVAPTAVDVSSQTRTRAPSDPRASAVHRAPSRSGGHRSGRAASRPSRRLTARRPAAPATRVAKVIGVTRAPGHASPTKSASGVHSGAGSTSSGQSGTVSGGSQQGTTGGQTGGQPGSSSGSSGGQGDSGGGSHHHHHHDSGSSGGQGDGQGNSGQHGTGGSQGGGDSQGSSRGDGSHGDGSSHSGQGQGGGGQGGEGQGGSGQGGSGQGGAGQSGNGQGGNGQGGGQGGGSGGHGNGQGGNGQGH